VSDIDIAPTSPLSNSTFNGRSGNSPPSRKPTCHPQRKHYAHGRCRPCHDAAYHIAHREVRNARSLAWDTANPMGRMERDILHWARRGLKRSLPPGMFAELERMQTRHRAEPSA
jgi:hypothetical protein